MKVVILLLDDCQPVSEAQGFYLPYNAKIVEVGTVTDEFQSSALVPFASSTVQMVNAVKASCVQAAAGRGKTVNSADCTVVGAIS